MVTLLVDLKYLYRDRPYRRRYNSSLLYYIFEYIKIIRLLDNFYYNLEIRILYYNNFE